MPATKSLTSGTWASTLLPIRRSGRRPSAASCLASSTPKKRTSVGTPRSSAAAATLAAGSIPSTGMPALTNHCSRYPSLLASSMTELVGPSPKRRVISSV